MRYPLRKWFLWRNLKKLKSDNESDSEFVDIFGYESDEDIERSVATVRAKLKGGVGVSSKKKGKISHDKKSSVYWWMKKKKEEYQALRDQVPVLKLPGLQKCLESQLKQLFPVLKPSHPKEKGKHCEE